MMNNDLILNTLTMSSLEIAKLTGKRHDNVVRDLKELEKQEVLHLLNFEELQVYAVGNRGGKKDRAIYNLPKRECLILVSGYSAVLRAKIIDRWLELEANKLTPELDAKLWAIARQKSKEVRKEVTDTIKEFVQYAESQGSKNSKFYYANITKGTYKALFLLEQGGNWKGAREYLTTFQLNQLATAEFIAQKKIAECMEAGTHYKDIYTIAIDEVEKLATLLGKSAVTYCNTTHLLKGV